METPVDTGLIGTRVMRMNEISLAGLLNESVELHQNINRFHLNLQILIIITPKNGSNITTMKYQRRGSHQKINFIHIIMCRHEENLCYIMINHEHNRRLFPRDILLHNNGTVTIGNLMSIIAPHLIIK